MNIENSEIIMSLSDDSIQKLADALNGVDEDDTGDGKDKQIDDTISSISKNISGLLNNADAQENALSGLAGMIPGVGGVVASSIVHALAGISKIIGAIGDAQWKIANQFEKAIDAGTDNLEKYLAPINARLYGLNDSVSNWYNDELPNYYTSMSKDIMEAFEENSYIEQVDILENLYSVVEAGIGYNIEQRAYLKTIADKTVVGFNVLNENLLNLIRLQQYDSTEGAMGAQSLVRHFLNSMFTDSSYMNDLYDSVYGAIYQANSQFTGDQSVVWTAAVETWLGSLYSVGISADTISKLASGINALSTGNLNALMGDSSLNTIFAMAAASVGKSYSDILRNGLGVDEINELMYGIVNQLQNISTNTSNNVVKSAWTDIIGTQLSDLVAINNLNNSEMQSIKEAVASYTYGGAIKELESQVALMQSEIRTSLSERISNTMNNMMYSVGSTIANNPELYGVWAKSKALTAWYDTLPVDILDIVKNINKIVTGSQVTNMIGKAIALVQDSDKYDEFNISDDDLDNVKPVDLSSFLKNYYKRATTLKGIDNKVNLNPFLWDQVMSGGSVNYSRGEDSIVSLLSNIGASESISYSTGINGSQTTSAQTVSNSVSNPNLQQNYDTYNKEISITSVEPASVEYTTDDIYNALFSEDKSIKVMVVGIADSAVQSLSENDTDKEMIDKLKNISMDINDIRLNMSDSNFVDILNRARML